MPRNFVDTAKAIRPGWLSLFWGERLTGTLWGFFADLIAQAASEAVAAPWLRSPTSPGDALGPAGADANIERAPGETLAQYRSRLLDKWRLWQEAATVLFARNALAPFGVPEDEITLIAKRDWEPDGNEESWSRFWVHLDNPSPWSELVIGAFTLGDGSTVGSTATLEQVCAVVFFLSKWKSAHEVGVYVIVDWTTPGDGVWGIGEWGAPLSLWEDRVAYWPLGRFWGADPGPVVPGAWGDPDPYDAAYLAPWGAKVRCY
jgi:hypothetical protein